MKSKSELIGFNQGSRNLPTSRARRSTFYFDLRMSFVSAPQGWSPKEDQNLAAQECLKCKRVLSQRDLPPQLVPIHITELASSGSASLTERWLNWTACRQLIELNSMPAAGTMSGEVVYLLTTGRGRLDRDYRFKQFLCTTPPYNGTV